MSLKRDVIDYLSSLTEEEVVDLYNSSVGYEVNYLYPMEEFDAIMQKFNFSMIDVADIASSYFYKNDPWFSLEGGDNLVSYSSPFDTEIFHKIWNHILAAVEDQSSLGDIGLQEIIEMYYGG